MGNFVKIRRLLIQDAAMLKEAGLYTGSRLEVEERIRSIIVDRTKLPYVVEIPDGDSMHLVCIAVFIPVGIDSANYNLYLDFADRSSFDVVEKTIDRLLYKAFFDKKIHKVSLVIEQDDEVLENSALACGMIQEAVLHDEIRVSEGKYKDAGLFYCLLPEYRGYNVGFVPFQRGVCAIYGTDEYVDRITIFHYGEKIIDDLAASVAGYLDLLDDEGCLRSRNSEQYSLLEDSVLPDEVRKAVEQLREYFIKDRTAFDINCRFMTGTSFQHQVWYALTDIPYGSTVSYEDIAYKLTDDPNEARKLTRAVGAACSENPIQIAIPCHRVIGKNGKLIGYAQGVDIKDFLLQHESLFLTII